VTAAPEPQLVWYAAYGSNLSLERFRRYLEGGTFGPAGGHRGAQDPTPPRASRGWWIAHPLAFAQRSRRWGGGVAFVGRRPVPSPVTRVRLHLITAGQLGDVCAQENGVGAVVVDWDRLRGGEAVEATAGWYGVLVPCGTVEGRLVVTFTAPWELGDVPATRPSPAYLATMAVGLRETFGLSARQVAEELAGVPGIAGELTVEELLDQLRGNGPGPPPG
jgi:hypothetical protein